MDEGSRSGRRPGPPESQSTTPRSFSPATRRLPPKKSPCPNPRGHAGEQAVEPRAPARRTARPPPARTPPPRCRRRPRRSGARPPRRRRQRAARQVAEALRQQGLSERRLRRRARKERLERPAREDRRALGLEPRQQSHDGGGRPRGRERGERRDLAVELRACRPDRHPQQRCLAERQHGAATHGHPARAQGAPAAAPASLIAASTRMARASVAFRGPSRALRQVLGQRTRRARGAVGRAGTRSRWPGPRPRPPSRGSRGGAPRARPGGRRSAHGRLRATASRRGPRPPRIHPGRPRLSRNRGVATQRGRRADLHVRRIQHQPPASPRRREPWIVHSGKRRAPAGSRPSQEWAV